MPAKVDVLGKKFGKLTVIRETYAKGYLSYVCECDCGAETVRQAGELRKPGNKMCPDCKRGATSKSLYKGVGDLSGDYWHSLKQSAKRRGLEFSICKAEAWELINKQSSKCAITGVPIVLTRNRKEEQTASLDRIDSQRGYASDNIQWVHKTINLMKSSMEQRLFVEWCKKVVEYDN